MSRISLMLLVVLSLVAYQYVPMSESLRVVDVGTSASDKARGGALSCAVGQPGGFCFGYDNRCQYQACTPIYMVSVDPTNAEPVRWECNAIDSRRNRWLWLDCEPNSPSSLPYGYYDSTTCLPPSNDFCFEFVACPNNCQLNLVTNEQLCVGTAMGFADADYFEETLPDGVQCYYDPQLLAARLKNHNTIAAHLPSFQ